MYAVGLLRGLHLFGVSKYWGGDVKKVKKVSIIFRKYWVGSECPQLKKIKGTSWSLRDKLGQLRGKFSSARG